MNLFTITDPLTRYLKTSGLDILKCIYIFEVSLLELKNNQRSMEFTKMMCNKFISKINNTISTRIYESKTLKTKKFKVKKCTNKCSVLV